MKELIIFYVGFTMGICFMDYIHIKDGPYLHLYRGSLFPIILSLLLAPITFPFYLFVFLKDKIQEPFL